jgi:hypothetical protein
MFTYCGAVKLVAVVCNAVGSGEGSLGAVVGTDVGRAVGEVLGAAVGDVVGFSVGNEVGCTVG